MAPVQLGMHASSSECIRLGATALSRPPPRGLCWSEHRCSQQADTRAHAAKRPSEECPSSSHQPASSKRELLIGACAALSVLQLDPSVPAARALDTNVGLRRWRDKIDGYTFTFPETWFPVTSSGNDIFFRNPADVEENLFVSISSASTSSLQSVADLGAPDAAADRTLRQYLEELKTTRLGVRRESDIISASSRTGSDGKEYYDIETRFKSYAARDQLEVRGRAPQFLEWDRNYVTVLGVANKRLYEFRLQSSHRNYENAKDRLLDIATSFTCKEML